MSGLREDACLPLFADTVFRHSGWCSVPSSFVLLLSSFFLRPSSFLPSFPPSFLPSSMRFQSKFAHAASAALCLTSQEVMEPISMQRPQAESGARPKIRPVRWCWHGAERKWLAQQRCFFMHTDEEQRDVPLRKEDQFIVRFIAETRAEVGILRDAVIRLSASTMWERGSVLTDGVQVIPQECAQARTSERCENIPAPLIKEDTAGVVQGLPPERDPKRIAEKSVHFLVFPINLSSVPSVPKMFPAKWRMKRANTCAGNPRSSPRQSADGQPSPAKELRLQGLGPCGQPDAGEK